MEQKEMMKTLTKALKTATVLENEPMKKHTTFHIGGNADIFIKVKEVEDLKTLILFSKEHHLPLTIIGNGSNVLVMDKGIRGIVLKTDIKNVSLKQKEKCMQITIRCRRKLNSTCSKMQRKSAYWFGICLWNSWYSWWSSSYECRSTWWANARCSKVCYLHRF